MPKPAPLVKPFDDGSGPAAEMSKREVFALAALVGLIMNPVSVSPDVPITKRAYELADYMVARGQGKEPRT